MTRKSGEFSIKTVLAVLAVVIVVTGTIRAFLTGSVASSAKTHITFWNGFTGPDGIVMLDIIKRFNQQNPDVEVTMQRIPWGTYYNKLTVAGSDGRGPALYICHADALPRLRRGGFTENADDCFTGKDAIPADDYDGFVLDRVKFGGHFIGVPLDIHPQGFYCDADMLKAAGITDAAGNAKVPRTREEFERAIKACTSQAKPDDPDKQWGFTLTDWGNNMRTLMPQFDGKYLDAQGNAVLDCPENVAALSYLSDLVKDGKVPPPAAGAGWFGFRQKKVAMAFEGVYMVGDLMRVQSFTYLGGMIPTIGKHPGTLANSHVLCIRKNLSPQEHEAAVRFIKFLSRNSLDWAGAGQVPARVSLRQTPRFAAMQVQHAFGEQVPYMMYPPKTPVLAELMVAFGLACEKAIRGQATPEDALKQANKDVQGIIDRDRKEHPEDQPQ